MRNAAGFSMVPRLLLITLLLAVSYCSQAGQTTELTGAYIIRGTNVRLRAAPNTHSEILAVLQGGDMIRMTKKTTEPETIAGNEGHWFKGSVQTGPEKGKVGWIFDTLIVPEEEGPYFQVEQASKIDDHEEAIQALRTIVRDFPRFQEVGLYSFQEIAATELSIRQCWLDRSSTTGAENKSELLDALKEATTGKNKVAVQQMLSCQFILMEGGCAGDPLPAPPSSTDIARVLQLAKNVNWSIRKKNCSPLRTDGDFCYSIEKVRGRYFFDFICTENLKPPA